MKTVNMKDMIGYKSCKKHKEYKEKLPYAGKKENPYKEAVLIRNTIEKLIEGNNPVSVWEDFCKEWETYSFLNKYEREDRKNRIIALIKRFDEYISPRKNEYVCGNTFINFSVQIGDEKISFSDTFTLVFKGEVELPVTDGETTKVPVIETMSIVNGKPELKKRGRTPKTQPQKNLNFIAGLCACKSYARNLKLEDAICINSVFYLKNTEDKTLPLGSVNDEEQYISMSESLKLGDAEELFKKLYDEQISAECTDCKYCEYSQLCEYTKVGKITSEEVDETAFDPEKLTLSPSQSKVVNYKKGYCRVNAGAGVGKTFSIVIRIIYLILNGVAAEEILVTTYTIAGIKELRERIYRIGAAYGIDEYELSKVKILTLNSIGDALLKKYYNILGYNQAPDVVDQRDKIDILLPLLEKIKLPHLNYEVFKGSFKSSYGVIPSIVKSIDIIKKNGLEYKEDIVEALQEATGNQMPLIASDYEELSELIAEYDIEMKNQNLIEYEDQENALYELREKERTIIHQEPLLNPKHLIVDEFQDCSPKQIDLVVAVASSSNLESLMVVGDDSQAIYGFKNTSPKFMINFEEYLGEKVDDIFITENRRSTPEIIDLANAINRLNKNRVDKELISTKGHGPKPILKSFNDPKIEFAWIANQVKKDIENGLKPEQIAILARTKKELNKIAGIMADLDIPVKMEVSREYIANSKVKAIVSFAEWIKEPTSMALVLPYLNCKYHGELMNQENPAELVDMFADNFLKEYYKEDLGERERLKILENVFNEIKEDDVVYSTFVENEIAKARSCTYLIERFIKLVEYESNESVTIMENSNAVTLVTAHSSKGREWDKCYVTVTEFQPGIGLKLEEWEEVIRLLFVSVTRAKQSLTITGLPVIGTKKNPYKNRVFSELEKFLEPEAYECEEK